MINNNLNPLIPKKRKKIIYSKNKAKPQFIKHPNQKKYETQKRKKSYLYQNDASEISSPSLSLSYHFDASCFFFHLLIHHYEKINKCWQIKRITIYIKKGENWNLQNQKMNFSSYSSSSSPSPSTFYRFPYLICNCYVICESVYETWNSKTTELFRLSSTVKRLSVIFRYFFMGPQSKANIKKNPQKSWKTMVLKGRD